MATRKELNRLPAVLRLATVAEALQNARSPQGMRQYLRDSDLSSESEDDEDVQRGPRNTSKNPDNYSQTFSGQARSISQPRALSRSRAKIPPKAVFKDLTTAHSSITSGEAGRSRSQSRTASASHELPNYEEEDSFQLQDLKLTRNQEEYHRLPLPPKAIAIPRGRRCSPNNSDFIEQEETQQQQQDIGQARSPSLPRQLQGHSVFSSIKNVLGTLSSPLEGKTANANGEYTRQASRHKETSSVYHTNPRDDMSLRPNTQDYDSVNGMLHPGYRGRDHGFYNEVMDFQEFPSTPTKQRSSIPRYKSNAGTPCHERSSIPEGSTVGNIYKHYIGSQHGESEKSEPRMAKLVSRPRDYFHRHDSNEHSSLSPCYDETSDLLQPSALNIRKQHRARRTIAAETSPREPPNFAPPNIPRFGEQNDIPSSPPVLSSPYNDTHDHLERPGTENYTQLKPSVAQSEDKNDSSSIANQAQSEWESSSLSCERHLSSNNPYKLQVAPKVIISYHHHNDEGDFTVSREPLEREVSKALRRASGYTTYSNGSISTSPLHYEDYQSDISTAGLLRKKESRVISPDSTSNGMINQFQTFYNKGALPSEWMRGSRQHSIRIPINHTGHFPASPPVTPFIPCGRNIKADHDDTDHEWETCDEKTADSISIKLGKRTGSSIADTSDYADSQLNGEITHYDSMERILKHPSSDGFGMTVSYRQRDLKNSNRPVLLPVFGEHKVNGQISNSSRFKPVPYRFTPRTPMIKTDHRHPFRTPPEIMTSPNGLSQVRQIPNPPQLSMNTLTTSSSSISLNDNVGPSRKSRSPARGWLSSFGLPGSSPATNHILRPSPPNRDYGGEINSWARVNIFEQGSVVPSFNDDGTLIDVNAFINQEDGPRTPPKVCRRTPLVNGPPGNFYQGVVERSIGGRLGSRQSGYTSTGRASRVSSHRPRLPDNFAETSKRMSPKQMRKQFEKVYPTDRLRPISLLSHNSIATVDQMHPSGFPAWKQSFQRRKKAAGKTDFTQEELARLDEEALAEVEQQRPDSQHGLATIYPKTLPPSKQMRQDKHQVSVSFLIMCNLFPPLLFFYATGKLDWIMRWYWRGNIKGMRKVHKRWAARLAAIWAGLILFALIFSLVYWAKVLHPRRQKG